MTWKQIETSREVRLWVKELIVPGVVIAAAIMSNPEAKKSIGDCFKSIKTKIKSKFTKKGA